MDERKYRTSAELWREALERGQLRPKASRGGRRAGGGNVEDKINALPEHEWGKDAKNPIPFVGEEIARQSGRALGELPASAPYKLEDVEINKLETRQDWVDPARLKAINRENSGNLDEIVQSDRGGIRAVRYKGHIIITDGNHRAALEKLRGKKKIKVYVIDAD